MIYLETESFFIKALCERLEDFNYPEGAEAMLEKQRDLILHVDYLGDGKIKVRVEDALNIQGFSFEQDMRFMKELKILQLGFQIYHYAIGMELNDGIYVTGKDLDNRDGFCVNFQQLKSEDAIGFYYGEEMAVTPWDLSWETKHDNEKRFIDTFLGFIHELPELKEYLVNQDLAFHTERLVVRRAKKAERQELRDLLGEDLDFPDNRELIDHEAAYGNEDPLVWD